MGVLVVVVVVGGGCGCGGGVRDGAKRAISRILLLFEQWVRYSGCVDHPRAR